MSDAAHAVLLYVLATAICVIVIAYGGSKIEKWRRKGWRE